MSVKSQIDRLSTAKTNIKSAISNKGVSVPSTAKLDELPDYVDQIETAEALTLEDVRRIFEGA